LSKPLDQLWLDPEKGHNRRERAVPATVLEYESSLPTKFLVGNENGTVFKLNAFWCANMASTEFF